MATNAFGKIASEHTIKDIRELCNKQGFTFERDKRYTCRRYVITETKTSAEHPVAFIPTMDEMYVEFEKLGIMGFIQKYKAPVRTQIVASSKQAVKVSGAKKIPKPKKITKKSIKEAERAKKLEAKQAKIEEKEKKAERIRQKKVLLEERKRKEANAGIIEQLMSEKTELCVKRLGLDCAKDHPDYVALQTQIIELREKIKELQ